MWTKTGRYIKITDINKETDEITGSVSDEKPLTKTENEKTSLADDAGKLTAAGEKQEEFPKQIILAAAGNDH